MINYVSTKEFFELKEKNKDKPFVLYGASYEGRSLAEFLKSLGHVVNFYCDRDINIIGKCFDGIPVIAPEKLSAENSFYFILRD